MLTDFERYEQLCHRHCLDDHREFLDACRWHFEHYAHYLGRRRHFVNYETYIQGRRGPLSVPNPPPPPPSFGKAPARGPGTA
jgi:hypothetical protein